ncbi:hypothetical protein SALBM311S_12503 [Streptomyces alboniger]
MTPQPSGPIRCSGTSFGRRTALRAGASAYVAKEDCPKNIAATRSPSRLIGELPSSRAPPKATRIASRE